MEIGTVICITLALTGCSFYNQIYGTENKEKNSIKVGISIYDQYDTFISSIVEELNEAVKEKEMEEGVSITFDIVSAGTSQIVQNDQVENFVNQGCDVICINLVDRTDASVVIDIAKNADIPVVFFNRELVEEDLEQWDKLYYVGAVTLESGIMQGELIVDLCREDFSALDKNGDNKLQYVILEGEAGHQDALIRTEYVVNKVIEEGIAVEKLGDEIANWSRAQAETKMMQWLNQFEESIEVVFSNNDDMALGAIDALREIERKDWPVIVGIDGTGVALEAVKKKEMAGTVLNDARGQAKGILELAYALGFHKPLSEEVELIEGRYIRLPHMKVTYDNVEEIMLRHYE